MKEHEYKNKKHGQSNADYVAGLNQKPRSPSLKEREKKQEGQENLPPDVEPYLKLFGMGETYDAYLRYKQKDKEAMGRYDHKTDSQRPAPQSIVEEATEQRQQLEEKLCAQGFNGLADFENHISSYIKGFEQDTVAIAEAHLTRYERELQAQADRYTDPEATKELHGDLGDFRQQQLAAEKYGIERTAHNRSLGMSTMTGYTFDKARPESAAKEKQHKVAATEQLTANAECHPILREKRTERANLDRG